MRLKAEYIYSQHNKSYVREYPSCKNSFGAYGSIDVTIDPKVKRVGQGAGTYLK